jgi:hypothetical protein
MTAHTIRKAYLVRIPEVPMDQIDSHPGGRSAPASPDFAASHAIFEEAHRLYNAAEYLRAADAFVRAALTLQVRSGRFVDTADRNRSALYDNAAYAWLLAGAAATGRQMLRALAQRGQATPADVRRALESLAAP